jgi:HlyD family secretion protein
MKAPSIVSILALAAISWAMYSVVNSAPHREVTQPPVPPPNSSFDSTIAANGLVEPSSEAISIGSPRAAVVDAVLVKAGDTVKKDQPLFKLRSRELEAELLVDQATLKQAQARVSEAESHTQVAQAQVNVAESSLKDAARMLDFANRVKEARVISEEERSQREIAVLTRKAQLDAAKASVSAAESSVLSAKAAVKAAEAKIQVTEVEIDRSTIKAPLDATVLQVRLRAGEFINQAGPAFMTLGQVQPLHIRADIDEHEAWRVKEGSTAEAQVRGNTKLRLPLKFVRFEPLVIPKRSLTGDATERVDTRVLQVIFAADTAPQFPLFVGQQMDVFIQSNSEVGAR